VRVFLRLDPLRGMLEARSGLGKKREKRAARELEDLAKFNLQALKLKRAKPLFGSYFVLLDLGESVPLHISSLTLLSPTYRPTSPSTPPANPDFSRSPSLLHATVARLGRLSPWRTGSHLLLQL